MPIDRAMLNRIASSALEEATTKANAGRVHVWVRSDPVRRENVAELSAVAAAAGQQEHALVLVDLHPDLNWTHPCEIRLHNPADGSLVKRVSALLPPADFYLKRAAYVPAHKPDVHTEAAMRTRPISDERLKAVPGTGERYAILFSGMSDNRHLNDLEYLYRGLIDIYHFKPANIIVLNYDGHVYYAGAPHPIGNWPGNNTPYRIKVNAPGTPKDLAAALKAMAGKLKAEDLLLIHTNNHGGGQPDQPEAWLCCYPNWGSYNATQFGQAVAALPAHRSLIVMMEQCHSGGFQKAVLTNSKAKCTSFAAACQYDKNSAGGANFDPFAYDWITAARVPANSARADFDYAQAHKVAYDTPVYGDKPTGCGTGQHL